MIQTRAEGFGRGNMKIRYAAKTDVGMKPDPTTRNYFSLIEDEQLFLVADGMGWSRLG